MKYLIIDAELGGTGIRDIYNGRYLELESLGLSKDIMREINLWLRNYQEEHYKGYTDEAIIDKLDREGIELAKNIKKELKDIKIEYFSDARLTKQMIE